MALYVDYVIANSCLDLLPENSVECIMTNHEYIVICGYNCNKAGHILAICASTISILQIFLLVRLAAVLHFFHFDNNFPSSF